MIILTICILCWLIAIGLVTQDITDGTHFNNIERFMILVFAPIVIPIFCGMILKVKIKNE